MFVFIAAAFSGEKLLRGDRSPPESSHVRNVASKVL